MMENLVIGVTGPGESVQRRVDRCGLARIDRLDQADPRDQVRRVAHSPSKRRRTDAGSAMSPAAMAPSVLAMGSSYTTRAGTVPAQMGKSASSRSSSVGPRETLADASSI